MHDGVAVRIVGSAKSEEYALSVSKVEGQLLLKFDKPISFKVLEINSNPAAVRIQITDPEGASEVWLRVDDSIALGQTFRLVAS